MTDYLSLDDELTGNLILDVNENLDSDEDLNADAYEKKREKRRRSRQSFGSQNPSNVETNSEVSTQHSEYAPGKKQKSKKSTVKNAKNPKNPKIVKNDDKSSKRIIRQEFLRRLQQHPLANIFNFILVTIFENIHNWEGTYYGYPCPNYDSSEEQIWNDKYMFVKKKYNRDEAFNQYQQGYNINSNNSL